MEAKVGIKYKEKNILFKINKKESLEYNIEEICKQNNLLSSQSYALKFDVKDVNLENYVTEENFNGIQNGFTLALVESLDSLIERIFKNVDANTSYESFQELFALSTDPGFIKTLVSKGRHNDILRLLREQQLSGIELSACLLILLHLLKKQYIKEVEQLIVKNIIKYIKNNSPPTPPTQLQYALAILCQILYLKGHEISKQMIIVDVSINDLIPFIWSQEHSHLQLNTLMLINAMVKSTKNDKRIQLIKELNRSKNREYIFNNIIQNSKIDFAMAHELYVYQTYILSLHNNALKNYVDANNSIILLRELESCEDDINRSSTFMDFEDVSRSRCNSTGTIIEDIENIRISFASVESEKSSNNELINYSQFMWTDQISYLTYECLMHYKKYHQKNYCQSRIEENAYEPGILVSGERITKLLANILHIGIEPIRSSISYHPLLFNSNLKLPFFLELFSRTMWLLSKTRREMRAWTYEDYSKVLLVIEKQIKMVLEEKPRDHHSLTQEMMKITYETVEKQWQKEKENEWKSIFEKNPSLQILKKDFNVENEKLIFSNRIKTLQKGDLFPKFPEKRGKHQYFFLRLSDNKRIVIWGDWDETVTNFKALEPEVFGVSDIKHVVIGKACPHVKDHSIKHPERAFSLILEEGEVINFFAKDIKTANYWIDGFNLLLGNSHRSEDYEKDLQTLLEMDCALHMLELQNVLIPSVAPIIPPLPNVVRNRPAIPPKSPNILNRKSVSPVKRYHKKKNCKRQNSYDIESV